MAQLFLPPSRILDIAGRIAPGAKAKFYLTGTLTPATVYADSDLSTALGSTVTADAYGKLPPIYYEEGELLRLIVETAAGVEIDDIDPCNASTFPSELATAGGSSRVGHLGAGTDAVSVDLQTLLRRTIVSPIQFGATGNGTADDTTGVQKAIDYCIANYPAAALDLSGSWRVSKVSASGGNGLNITGNGVITANSGSAQTALFEIKMPGVVVDGALKLAVGYRTNYETGLHVFATGTGNNTCQFCRLDNITVNGAKIGARIGSVTYPGALASELRFTGFSTYGCPIPVEVVGAETYVTFSDPLISADDFGGDAAWQAQAKRGMRIVGGDVVITGGEVLMTADNNEALFEVQPITGPTQGTFYGSIRAVGVTCETASPLVITTNPNGLVINSTYKRRGLISFRDCRGYHGQDLASFITTDADFEGDVIISGNRFWHGGTRTQNNITCGSTDTHVYMDDLGFGDGFKSPWNGVSGGTVHPSSRIVLQYQDPQSQSLSVGANTIKWKVAAGVDTARWEAGYSTSTGIWTSPDTFANLHVRAQVAFASAASGTIIVIDNGTGVRTIPFTSQTEVSIDWSTANYVAGRTIKIDVNLSVSSNTVNSAGYLSRLTIEGRN